MRPDRDRMASAASVARATAPGALLAVLGVLAFAGLLDAVREGDDLSGLDGPVLDWMVAHRSGPATAVLAGLTFVTGPVVLPVVVLVACVAWGLVRRAWWRPVLLVLAMVGSTLLSLAVKGLVDRPRPPADTMHVPGSESTASFPSGHTMGTATLLLVAGYLVCSRGPTRARLVGWAVAALLGTAAVALSRLYLGYHFLTDVLAAVALAVAVLGLVSVVDRLRAPDGAGARGEPVGESSAVVAPR
ncbi:phosphatase PAP2 family protein [Cellulomonas hominis]